MAPDWHQVLDQLMHAGLSRRDISQRIGCDLTLRMIAHYKNGAQPLHYRGEALIAFWCETLQRTRDQLPVAAVVRGHRVNFNRDPNNAPQMRAPLPQWPPIHQMAKATKARKAATASAPRKKAKEPA
jgi:hypothetical protein